MFNYIKNNRLLFSAAIITGIISSLGYVFIAVLLQNLLDIAISQNMKLFAKLIVFSLAYFIILGIFMYLQSLFEKKIICKIIFQLRSDAFHGILNHSIADFDKKNTADFISSITNDVKIIEDNFLIPLFEVIQNTVIFMASFAIMLYFDLIVTVCVIVAITIMFLVPGLMGGILEKRQSRFSQQLSAFTSTLKDILSGFEVIKTYSMKKYITCKFDGSNEGTANGKYSVDVISALNEGLSVFLALMVQVVVLFLSAYFIITDRITVGTMLGMVQVSSNLANPILMIFINIPKIKSARSITHKLKELSDYQTNQSQKKRISDLNHCISIKNLSFSYDGQTDILKNISCTIEKGKKYAILGKSGCGKSTLVKLLSGYYTGYEGNIFYDNTELKTLCKNDVAGLSSIIHQNIYMFDETIYDNICLHETYSQTRIDGAVSASGLSTFVSALPEGLSYKAGENGSNLSGGQKQRIAVARALIRNKPVLVLDEGTSAIDMQTAYDIETRLLKIKDLTMITITHSLNKELLAQYDTIIYMEAGKISDSGSFTQLLGRNPGFAEYIKVAESTEEKTTH